MLLETSQNVVKKGNKVYRIVFDLLLWPRDFGSVPFPYQVYRQKPKPTSIVYHHVRNFFFVERFPYDVISPVSFEAAER